MSCFIYTSYCICSYDFDILFWFNDKEDLQINSTCYEFYKFDMLRHRSYIQLKTMYTSVEKIILYFLYNNITQVYNANDIVLFVFWNVIVEMYITQ